MKTLKLLTLIIIFALLFPVLTIAASLTLQQCINRGLANNPEVKAYQLAVEEAGQGVNEAWGAFLPTLSFNYGYNDLTSNNNGSGITTDYLDQTSDTFSCRLSQPLFTGLSGIAGLKRARQSKRYRQVESDYMKKQLIKEISTSFYSLLHANQQAVQWEKSVQRLEQQKNIAAAWVKQRLAPRLRLYEVEVEISNARFELIRAKADKAVATAQLREWLAYDPLYDVQIDGSLQLETELPCLDLNGCYQQALDHRPEIELAELNIEMARQDAKIIVARNLPQASLDASWTDYQRDYSDSRIPSDNREYYTVSLNLSIKPFQGGRNVSAWRKQRLAEKRLQQRQISQHDSIISEVQILVEKYKESKALIDTAKNTLSTAREAYELSAKSAELGIVSLDDLLDAELRLTRAEVQLTNSYAALQQAQILLDFALGYSDVLPPL